MTGDRRGSFISFEGGEGAGKSTQILALKRRLESAGKAVVVTREPGGSPRAEAIREFLLGGGAEAFGPLAEAMLFAAARAEHVATLIRPELELGTVVLCDRFSDSTRVYQGAVGQVPPGVLVQLDSLTTGGLAPDLTLILDVPVEIGLNRARRRRERVGGPIDRFEGEGTAYHEAVRRSFLAIAAAEPHRCVVIDATMEEEGVRSAIADVVFARLSWREGESDHGG